ncbi:hypothetical protein E2C01_065433 [Portunus trituberculatus]|uniref:Uncharacterized protein n=1 Tax=Portunus trituberculatus TaxID=210409 RepID=A0A5B7HLW5_PORTR|nr:hypothetical protein [Portunus trituberculatus]
MSGRCHAAAVLCACRPCEAAPLGIFERPQHVVLGSQGCSLLVMEYLSGVHERGGKENGDDGVLR